MRAEQCEKPMGRKAYGHIPHLSDSRMGPGDHACHEGQSRICQVKARDRHDRIIVQEKVDGSCCAVFRASNGALLPLGRAGYLAWTSPYEQHRMFAQWVADNESCFGFLREGARVVGEWLAQAHGTRYDLPHGPFVAFDIMNEATREPFDCFMASIDGALPTPRLIHDGGPFSVASCQPFLKTSGHGAIDPVEGAVWRVERRGKVDFLAKWVRSDKVDGSYLEAVSGKEAVWNWRP